MKEKFDGLIERLLDANVFLPEAIEILERSMIHQVLDRNNGNQCVTAKQLGIHRNTLQRKMAEFGIGNGRPKRKPVVKAGKARKRKSSVA